MRCRVCFCCLLFIHTLDYIISECDTDIPCSLNPRSHIARTISRLGERYYGHGSEACIRTYPGSGIVLSKFLSICTTHPFSTINENMSYSSVVLRMVFQCFVSCILHNDVIQFSVYRYEFHDTFEE